ncbi:uncharacterized protein THITE_2127803 [Thermothielavioides terrestris NRRL 8126]|uniref:Uncharacterized protein n=1 Tax=Thermothielavioides terrestris (strain ATCC 38088 / NRRL 8126) TaxID=578455 RepID=G2R0H0_THETT|nr:uncharacterized protein THITE_2127803 [Thermothielavioides terrestris NRRL 8126]AEO65635.1 hypothetical protein THITE_2127803 [Thermothielavioides terrestris NRRL 8126]
MGTGAVAVERAVDPPPHTARPVRPDKRRPAGVRGELEPAGAGPDATLRDDAGPDRLAAAVGDDQLNRPLVIGGAAVPLAVLFIGMRVVAFAIELVGVMVTFPVTLNGDTVTFAAVTLFAYMVTLTGGISRGAQLGTKRAAAARRVNTHNERKNPLANPPTGFWGFLFLLQDSSFRSSGGLFIRMVRAMRCIPRRASDRWRSTYWR